MTVDKLLEVMNDQAAELDEIVDDLIVEYNLRVTEILKNIDQRNEEIFLALDADIDLLLSDFDAIPVIDRNNDWSDRLVNLLAASRAQAYMEIFARRLLDISDSHADRSEPLAETMTKDELKKAAKIGISKESVDLAREKRIATKATKS